ncbi:protein rep [Lactobacillus sp. AN1001]
MRSTEITVAEDGSYNQHMHVFLMVKPNFFNSKENYIEHKKSG